MDLLGLRVLAQHFSITSHVLLLMLDIQLAVCSNANAIQTAPEQIEYPRLVDWLVASVCKERGIDPATAHSVSLGAQGKWYERLASVANRCVRVHACTYTHKDAL